MTETTALPGPPLPAQPRGVPWPTEDWPLGEVEARAGRRSVEAAVDALFAPEAAAETGETLALVIVQGGRLALERYAPATGREATQPSWSMAKSITHALVGFAVGDGVVDTRRPPVVPEWTSPGDPRGAITLDQMLRMSSGLEFIEDYAPEHVSDVIEMLFGSGRPDVAAYAASKPRVHAPGSYWSYSSGATNIICRSLGRSLGLNGQGFHRFMRERLFDPIGMKSPIPKFDAAGTFIGSSYCFATPRDFARFGLLYLRDGAWEGRRLLPEGWVDYGRTPTWRQPDALEGPYGPYGAHWWLDGFGAGVFSANGYAGQYVILRPDRDLILVRSGRTPPEGSAHLQARLKDLVALFD